MRIWVLVAAVGWLALGLLINCGPWASRCPTSLDLVQRRASRYSPGPRRILCGPAVARVARLARCPQRPPPRRRGVSQAARPVSMGATPSAPFVESGAEE